RCPPVTGHADLNGGHGQAERPAELRVGHHFFAGVNDLSSRKGTFCPAKVVLTFPPPSAYHSVSSGWQTPFHLRVIGVAVSVPAGVRISSAFPTVNVPSN